MIKRHATAHWAGSGKEGKGSLTTGSGTLTEAQYGFTSRFAEGTGTNPEELVAAAHSGCFSMKLSFVLGAEGKTPDTIETKCTISFADGTITGAHLDVTASVPDIEEADFLRLAEKAKVECPISKLLNCPVTMEAKLK